MWTKYGILNNVRADNQLPSDEYVRIFQNNGEIRILFVGNSITRHGPAPEIGWYGDWGMAASKQENDYVHLVVSKLRKYTSVDYCIAQCSIWERNYKNGSDVLTMHYKSARNFNADIIVIRIGENMKMIGDENDCKKSFKKMITYFDKHKKARIIVTNLFWEQPKLNKIIHEIAIANNYVFCNISDLEKNEKTMALGKYEHEGVSVHPSDYGMKCIADKIITCILDSKSVCVIHES